jgi:hypothetical protein
MKYHFKERKGDGKSYEQKTSSINDFGWIWIK